MFSFGSVVLKNTMEIWDAIRNAHEGVILRNDAHTDMLHAMFTHFISLWRESVMEITDRLTNIVDRLRQWGIEDITDHDVINKLFSALDETFDLVVSEIKARPDFEELHSVEIMTLLTIHEKKMEMENSQSESSLDEEWEIFSDYGSGHEL